MPIDFNQQTFFDPKIDIIGKEVPLAEIEKTGNVLQNRFDKSYEQYSAADEALKQMEARANPVDREKAKELRSIYKEEMDKILEQGDFHNMRRQTENLARNAAINYKVIEEKNAAIQKGLEEIAKSPKYQLDPEGAKQDYLKSLQSINFNPETRTISDFNVGTYNAAADVNIAEKGLKIAPTLRTKTKGGEDAKFVQQLFDGKPVWTKVSTSGKTEYLSADEISSELGAYLKTDPEVQAYIARDTGRLGYDVNTDEGLKVYNNLLNERINGSTKALGNMYSVDNVFTGKNLDVVGGGLNSGGGGGDDDYANVVPVNTVADALGGDTGQGKGLRTNFISGLTDNKSVLNNIQGFVKEQIKIATMAKNPELVKKYSKYKDTLDELKKSDAETQKAVADYYTYGKIIPLGRIVGNVNRPDAEVKKKEAKISNIIANLQGFTTTDFVDTDTENAYQQYATDNNSFQNVNLNAISIQDQETNNKVQSFLTKSLATNDFETFKGKLDPKANYTLAKVTDRPLGNGTGILFELKDQGTGETVLVTPKDSRMLEGLYGIFPGMKTDIFKNTSDFSKGETRTIPEILKENGHQIPKGDPNTKKSIRFTKEGIYQKLDENEKVIDQANHFVDLLK
jgi:hypothetical protein